MSHLKPLSPLQITEANKITATLHDYENALDIVVAKAGELAMLLPRFRAAANLPAVAGQSALDSFGEAMSAAIRARGHVVNGHRALERTGRVLGYDAHAYRYGDTQPKPEFEEPKGVIEPLRHAA